MHGDGTDHYVADDHQQQPCTQFRYRHHAPCMTLRRITPRRRKRADVLRKPDERRHQYKTQQQRHAPVHAPDSKIDPCAPEQHGHRNE